MRVRTVGVNQITGTEALSDLWLVLTEVIYADDACNRLDIGLGDDELIQQPCLRNTAVRICIGKPVQMSGTFISPESSARR